MTRERTFLMVKPEGVQRGIVGEIVQRFERRGYQLVAAKLMHASEALLREHYQDLQAKPFFAGLIKHMSSGPVFAMVFEGSNIVKVARVMLGETNPLSSLPGSIRGDLAIDIGRNVCHGSDSLDSADREIKLWFPEGVISYSRPQETLIYERTD
jgi:nucleoside-diphosphate kinase